MIPCKSPFPPGMVGVISHDLSRYPEFTQALLRLYVPEGTVWSWIQGNGFALNRNTIVDKMLHNEPKCEWLWFVDDDQDFERDILMQLLSRREAIVQPLVATRKPPYYPYTYQKNPAGDGYITIDFDKMPERGLIRCDAVGTGGVLIQREVFEAVGYPWYEEGKTCADGIGEDLYFCEKAKALGYSCFVDTDHSMEHIGKYSVRPVFKQSAWYLEFNMGHGVAIHMPWDFARDLTVFDSLKAEEEMRDRQQALK